MIYIIWQYFYAYESFLLEGNLEIISLNVLSIILIIMTLSPGVSFMYKGETITLKLKKLVFLNKKSLQFSWHKAFKYWDHWDSKICNLNVYKFKLKLVKISKLMVNTFYKSIRTVLICIKILPYARLYNCYQILNPLLISHHQLIGVETSLTCNNL